MNSKHTFALAGLALVLAAGSATAAVTAEEAARLKSSLTPLGAERAANREGTIPAWTAGYSTPHPGWKAGERRPDPFAADKPLYSVDAKNMSQHADKLTEGSKALLQKFPDSYRIDVYPTRRTAGAPQWVYDNTAKNATRAKLVDGEAGLRVDSAYGGIPFPIPKTGEEVMWNSALAWRGQSRIADIQGWFVTASGSPVLTAEVVSHSQWPYYYQDGSLEKFQGDFVLVRLQTMGPPIRAGEGLASRQGVDPHDDTTWSYLPGQRRVRKLTNACCDTPSPATAGLASIDELSVFSGRLERFNWKLVGKKEMLIPYNSNRTLQPAKASELVQRNHLNPDHVRWELHRVWVVEADLAPGKRHVAPKSRYYIDEDSWLAVMGERYDARGQLWKVLWQLPYVIPELHGVSSLTFGFNDLQANNWYVSGVMNEKRQQMVEVPKRSETFFSPNALAAEGVR